MYGNANTSTAFRGLHHRRAHSEVSFRLPDDMDMSSSEPGFTGSTNSLEEIGSEDDLFSTYIDLDKLGGNAAPNDDAIPAPVTNYTDHHQTSHAGGDGGNSDHHQKSRPTRHRHCNSVDGGGGGGGGGGEILDAKKAMPPDKLAELWTIDPKRAKRILANRQSAARSKERKARYIIELERKVQTLQTEATTLSAQMTLFQRDTTDLTTENAELKLRLQAMEQQAQLRDALNEALKKEVDRLKIETGELMCPSESFNLERMHNMPYSTSAFFGFPQQPGAAGHQNLQLPPFHDSESGMSSHHMHPAHSHALSEFLQNDPIGRLQGLDISSRGSHLMKSEGPSISASESSTT